MIGKDPLPDVEGVVESKCGVCGLPIDRFESGVRHFGTYIAHSSGRCVGLLRALITRQQAQIEALKGERDEAKEGESRWLLRVSAIREASGLGARPMLGELPGEIAALASRAQAAEARSERLSALVGRCEEALESGEPLDAYWATISALLAELSEEGLGDRQTNGEPHCADAQERRSSGETEAQSELETVLSAWTVAYDRIVLNHVTGGRLTLWPGQPMTHLAGTHRALTAVQSSSHDADVSTEPKASGVRLSATDTPTPPLSEEGSEPKAAGEG